MKIPTWAASILLTALLSVQAWTLIEIVNLKVAVATLAASVKGKNESTLANVTPQRP